MARRKPQYVILRESTPAERREEIVMLVLGGAFSLLTWGLIALCLWRLLPDV